MYYTTCVTGNISPPTYLMDLYDIIFCDIFFAMLYWIYDYVYLRHPLRFKFEYYGHEGTAEPIISHFSTHISITNEHICDDYVVCIFKKYKTKIDVVNI